MTHCQLATATTLHCPLDDSLLTEEDLSSILVFSTDNREISPLVLTIAIVRENGQKFLSIDFPASLVFKKIVVIPGGVEEGLNSVEETQPEAEPAPVTQEKDQVASPLPESSLSQEDCASVQGEWV